jgi:hypothetical protein
LRSTRWLFVKKPSVIDFEWSAESAGRTSRQADASRCDKAHPDSTACTIIDFLTAIRLCPQSPSNAAQRAFLSVGLLQLIHDSGTKILGAILNHETDQSGLKAH